MSREIRKSYKKRKVGMTMLWTHCARKLLVTALLLGTAAPTMGDERLAAAKAAYDQAFEHYTRLVTTEAGTSDVVQALQEYKQAHTRYMTLRNSSPQAPTEETANAPLTLDTTGIEGIESIGTTNDAPAENTAPPTLSALKSKADEGDPAAMDTLALAYQTGYGGQTDPYRAIELLEKAVKADDANAMAALADEYESGLWVKQDKNKAAALRKQAAQLGSRLAEWELKSHE